MGVKNWQHTSWVAIVLLVMNLTAGLALPAPVHVDDGSLCTQLGIVHTADAGKGVPAKSRVCAYCLPLLHGGLDSATHTPVLADAVRLVGPADQSPLPQPFAATPVNSRNQRSRAPPLLVI